jgi:hypothetical protein
MGVCAMLNAGQGGPDRPARRRLGLVAACIPATYAPPAAVCGIGPEPDEMSGHRVTQ